MLTTDQAQQLLTTGGNVIGDDGKKIGGVGQVFLDDQTGEPEWVTVKTGMFGGAESFVPIGDAQLSGQDLRVPYGKDKVKDAPRISDPEGHLSHEEEDTLYRHYQMSDRTRTRDQAAEAGSVGHDTSGPNTDSAMTRSEEQLHVSKETVQTGRARMRKYIVTENVTQTVPVSHEEVRIEREPITDANRGDAMTGGDLTTEDHEVVLSEERVVVDKETVPVERVRVEKDTVAGQQQVDETVRKEQIELEGTGSAESAPDGPAEKRRG